MVTDKQYFDYLRDSEKGLKSKIRIIFLRSLVKHFQGDTLDIGCGIGSLFRLYPRLKGIDTNRFSIAYCKKKGYDARVSSIMGLKFKKNSFDTVVMNNVLEHVSDTDKAMQQVWKVLKKGGVVVIEVPGIKGYEFDETHKKFIDENTKFGGFRKIKQYYYPIPFKFANKIFTHNKLRIILKK